VTRTLWGALLVLLTAGLAGLPAVPGHPATSPVQASARPNVVVVMADDMRTDDLRFMPAVRRLLVRPGLNFRNSFSPDPLCCPARASFLTGQAAHNHGVLSHINPFGFGAFNDRRTLATALRAGGYQTGFVGKYLNEYGRVKSRVTGRSSFRYVPPGWSDWYGAVERPRNSGYASGGTYNYLNTLFNVNGRIDTSHRGEYQTDVIGGFARRLVGRYARSAKPFFLYLSSVAPHNGAPREADDPVRVRRLDGSTYTLSTPARPRWARGHFDRVITRGSGIPVAGTQPENDLTDKPRPMRSHSRLSRAEMTAVRELTRQRAESLLVLDREVSRLVAKLKATGEWRDTVLVFTSDNGYFLGEHRVREGKTRPHEPSLRVPMVVAGRGVPRGERFDPVTTLDLTATIADLAGVTARMPFALDGTSFTPSLGADTGWTRPVLYEGLMTGKAYPRRAAHYAPGFTDKRTGIGLRTGAWKYIRYSNAATEMYHLDADPNELDNVAGAPEHAEVEAALERLWWQLKDCAGATCRAPLPELFSRGPAENRARTDLQSGGVEAMFGYWR
jgi:arylsulfatase A-like enzyme